MIAEPDKAKDNLRCPKCGKQVESLQCGHCGSQLPDWQADLYGATIRQLAKLGGNRADASSQGGTPAEVEPTGNGVHGKRFNRPGDDFYPTPPEAVEALLRCEQFDGQIWEPACGDGAISRILVAHGHEVHSSDKVDRGYGEVADFLKTEREVQHIITNPPYNQAEEFIEHALTCATGKVAMLLRLAFLEGQQRHEKWNRWPLKTVWVFSKRISMYPDKHQTGHGLYPYAWFIWDNAHQGTPEIRWISSEVMGGQPDAEELVQPQPAAKVEEKITRPLAVPRLTDEERHLRQDRTSLIEGDAVTTLKTIPDGIGDLCLFDPPYPEITRPYGRLTEDEWHDLMKVVLRECKRILKPHGSVVVVLQPNYEKIGRMRLWPWKFVRWAAEMWPEWGLVEDVYSFAPNALPSAGTARQDGLLRKAIKWCVWLGPADCYRNQDAVLAEAAEYTVASRNRTDDRPAKYLGGFSINMARFRRTLEKRGGVTPRNLLVVPTGTPVDHQGHPAVTSYRLAEWWCRYLLPPDGVLIDPFCGSGTTLLAALNCGATRVFGIDKEADYLERARERLYGETAQVIELPPEPASVTASDFNDERQEQVWSAASEAFALEEVEAWRRRKLTEVEEVMRRFFKDKSWLVGGPIPLCLLYEPTHTAMLSDEMTIASDDEDNAADLEQLTGEMKSRGIDQRYHAGLIMLYKRLCRLPSSPAKHAGLAS